jgi:zinc protease
VAGLVNGAKRAELANGMTVAAAESGAVPTFAAVLALEAGSRHDPAGKSGLAALAGGLLLEAPDDGGASEAALAIETHGGSVDLVTGYETTTVIVTGLTESFGDSLSCLAEMVRSPRFDRASLETERRRQTTGIAEDDDEPYLVGRREFIDLVFPDHPRGRPVSGSPESVRAITDADVRRFLDERCVPGGAVLAVSGDVDAGEVVEAAEAAFGDWRGAPPDAGRFELPSRATEIRSRFVKMEREQSHVFLGGPGITRSDRHYYAARVMDVILGDSAGFGSRLASRLREDEGLAYVVESDTCGSAGRDPGMFWAYVATSPEHVGRAIEGIVDEMRRIRSEPPSAIEMSSAIAYLTGRHTLERETIESRAHTLVRMERYDLGLDYDERYASIVAAVTAENVLAAARRVIDPDAYSMVVVGPRAARRGH